MALQTFTAGQVLTAAQLTTLQANAYNQTVSNKVASYVLVAADRGTRVVMSNASATTITVNSGLFTAGDTLFIQNIGAGTCTITAGTCTVTTAGSLALAQWGGGTLYFTSASAAIFFSGAGNPYGVATGGTSSNITVSGSAYTMLTFTSLGTLTVTRAGVFDVFIVGGGGGGGSNGGAGGRSGGGAGGIVTASVYLPATTYTCTIGAGSAYQATGGTSSLGVTTIGSLVAPLALGGGGYGSGTPLGNWGQFPAATGAQTTQIPSQTNNGGGGDGANSAGGGAGAGANGSNAAAGTGGAGGAGFDASTWRGETAGTTRYAAGGGGGGATTGGAGGTGGGGAGGGGAGTGANATGNGCGGGGNGSTAAASGGTGSNGIILVRFKV